ncbi:hypothetical protein ACEPPN_012321 [Leptodophora sp. 'Broadleaf-Isolate-01']
MIVANGRKISALVDDVHDMASQWEEVRDQLRMYGTRDLWMPTQKNGSYTNTNTNTTPRLALLDSLHALTYHLGTCTTLLPELPAHLVALLVKIRITIKQTHAAVLQLNRRRPDDVRELTRQCTIRVDAVLQYLERVVGVINEILVADEEAKKGVNTVWYGLTGCETWLDEQVQDRLNSPQPGFLARWTEGTAVATRNKPEQEQWENLQRAKLIREILGGDDARSAESTEKGWRFYDGPSQGVG